MTWPMFQEPTPEEIDRAKLQQDEQNHRLLGTVGRMTDDQLETVQTILQGIMHSQSPLMYAQFWFTHVQTVRQHKFHVCMACNKNHDTIEDLENHGTDLH